MSSVVRIHLLPQLAEVAQLVEHQPSKLEMGVRFSYPAPNIAYVAQG